MIRISQDKHVFTMSVNNTPAATCRSGDTVVFETLDCFCNHFHDITAEFGVQQPKHSNPATGPLYVEEAEPGDALKVEVLSIELGPLGVYVSGPVNPLFEPFLREFKVNRIHVENGYGFITSNHKLSITPMIGVIGTAFSEISTSLPGNHGGNLDCSEIKMGSTLILPVFTKGGLLAVGDLHTMMGDGELGENGLEIDGKVTLRVSLIKGKAIERPMIIDLNEFGIIGLGASVDDAVRDAAHHMMSYLINEVSYTPHEASMLIGLVSRIKICQQVNQSKTVLLTLPKPLAHIAPA